MAIILSSIILLFLIFASGYFSGSETALFSLSTTKIKTYRASSNPLKQMVARLVLEPRDLLVTVFMLNTLVNILLQNVVSHLGGTSATWMLKVGVPFVITLIFGEIIPKNIGMQHNEAISLKVIKSINLMHRWLAPIRKMTVAVTTPISKILFFFLKKEMSISKEELQHVLQTSQEHGVLTDEEERLVRGYLNFQDATVREVMRPRDEVLYYDMQEPITKLLHLFIDQECSRIPVCEGSLDRVLGVITARRFFFHRNSIENSADLKKYLTKPFFIPETTQTRLLLRRFDENQEVFSLVVDEYGAIAGLITKEDVLELVVGEIEDLRDSKALYTLAGEHEIIASGKLELMVLNELLDVQLSSPADMVTIGGWLIERLGEIPKAGTQYEAENLLFQVLAADPNRIRRLYIRRTFNGMRS